MAPAHVAELAAAFGIATEFWDWKGHLVRVSDETIIRILRSMGVDASTPDAAEQALQTRRVAPWRRPLPPVVVVEDNGGGSVNVHVDSGAPAVVRIELEDGTVRDVVQIDNWEPDRLIDGRMVGEATFAIPAGLPLGYHRLVLDSAGLTASTLLMVTPHVVGIPAAMGEGRTWGYAAQLYSVRSARSWAMGDLSDLTALAQWSAQKQSAGYVLVNPLHAAEPMTPIEPSPYFPSSRRYVNPLYIRPEAIEEYATASPQVRADIDKLREKLIAATDPNVIDRNAVWEAKMAALRLLFTVPRSLKRQQEFAQYRASEGEGLKHFSWWWVLAAHLGVDWRDWPVEYQRTDSPAVEAFVTEHADDVFFAAWLQWIADTQLNQAQAAAREAGMALGIVNDLAVGVSPQSADVWTLGDAFAAGVTVGAPADPYNQLGQNWNQAPWSPDKLEELEYAPFRAMVAGILRHSGGVRIDHVMGLFRLWWIPAGMGANQGSYVRYNHEAMVGIVALEAHRAGALVVGEDLGTVEPWVRDYLRDRGILGTSIAWFESNHDGTPLVPHHYREYCMASVTTHDLPPTAGYLQAAHLKLQHELGLLTEGLDHELNQFTAHMEQWRQALDQAGMLDLDEGEDEYESIMLAMHRYLTHTPSRVLSAALTDAVGDRRIQNQPGTVDEYPNWRVPLSGPDGVSITLEDIFDSERAQRLADVMNSSVV